MEHYALVVNAGSSSLKFCLFQRSNDHWQVGTRGQVEGIGTTPRFSAKDGQGSKLIDKPLESTVRDGPTAVAFLSDWLRSTFRGGRIVGVGHRVVHGGPDFRAPVIVTPEILTELEKLTPLAPLHQPHNLAPIAALLERSPDIPQVACFDTAFHRTNPEVAQRYALPQELHDAGVRRYGFHGLSYEYIASVLGTFDEQAAAGRTVVLHLGNGASMCALEAGRSMASTMGFTALDGLPMGTRSGSLDPGVLLYLMDQRGMDARAIEKLLYQQSGLLGVSASSSDMRTLLASDAPRAKIAVDLFCYRIRRELGSLAAALGGLDAIVFTGGIGENSAVIRERVCRDASWLGVELDAGANATGGPRISSADSPLSAWTIPTNEELMIARHTRRILEQI